MRIAAILRVLIVSFSMVGCVSSSYNSISVEPAETSIPTPASAVAAITYISSNNSSEQIVGMWAILKYPESIENALPPLIDNLSDPILDVRINAAKVLGEFGPSANTSAPDLVRVMKNDNSEAVKIEAAIALGYIGDKATVPYLAENLFGENQDLAVYSAKSISLLTSEPFPDAQSSGYHSDSNVNPYILLAAQDWWKQKGKYQNWSTP